MLENSLHRLFENLGEDIASTPMQISAHHDLPFAILCYPAEKEMESRKLIKLCAARVTEKSTRTVRFLSIGKIFWDALKESQGLEKIEEYEKSWGYERAENRIFKLLASERHAALQQRVEDQLSKFSPENDVVFMVRSSALAPSLYRVSTLLEGLYRKTSVPAILFYPGSYEGGNSLRFMNLSGETHLASPQYRVKIYGIER